MGTKGLRHAPGLSPMAAGFSLSLAQFAIGSAARVVSVGYYDPESKWWACKMIRKVGW